MDDALHVRIPVKAGRHEIGAGFLKKPSTLLETERQPYQAHFNMDRSPRPQLALYSVAIAGPFDQVGVAETPSRQRIFVCRPAQRVERRRVCEDDSDAAWRDGRIGGR